MAECVDRKDVRLHGGLFYDENRLASVTKFYFNCVFCSCAESSCRLSKYPPMTSHLSSSKSIFFICSSLFLPTSVCPGIVKWREGSQKQDDKRRWISDARKLWLVHEQTVTCRPSHRICGSTSTVTFHTSARGAARLIWQHRLFISPMNSSGFLLFSGAIAEPFIYNGMYVVIVIHPETEHVLNKQKPIWLTLFSFFLLALNQLWNMNRERLYAVPYHGF